MDFSKIEKKWQAAWEKAKIFESGEKSKKKKFYCLEMFPYPSGSGLHMGHTKNYVIGDIFARFKRMKGFNVLYPMGYDAFGLPAENAAIKAGVDPEKYTKEIIANFVKQQKAIGLSYDWSRIIATCEPEYYKWNQFFFLKFFEKGLVYRKKAAVNWCPKCQTVLANEQVQGGVCWRHTDTQVEIKQLEQWFVKTTNYADELLDGIKNLDWPERIKIMQENWIGKSFGTEILFKINKEKWPIFTTRPDTIFGVTFMVVSAQHPRLMELTTPAQKKSVEEFLKKIKSTSEREAEELNKEGAFTGSYAINPATGEKIPIYAGNFVIADYGSGMVMAVPAHDQRDFEFAKKYGIEIKLVVQPKEKELKSESLGRAFAGDGILANSKNFSGIENRKAIEEITKYLESKKLGRKVVNYKLRDWLISRQRYWGTPIPIIYCGKCGIVPVPEKDLPILLPKDVKFGQGNPLLTSEKFVKTKCPKCKSPAKRETDTMDTFFDSSWYFLRYCDSKNSKIPFEKKKAEYWMPVDQYIGGAEHACMHLIYARFFTKVLRDIGMLKFGEPFPKLFNQGMLHKDGFVMSKSRGNVVSPDDVSKKYGIDAARFFLMFAAAPDRDTEWTEDGIESGSRVVSKLISIGEKKFGKDDLKLLNKLHRAIIFVEENLEKFQYNFALVKLSELIGRFEKAEYSRKSFENLLLLFSPFMPHICEELWHKIGNKSFVSEESWPVAEKKFISEELEQQEKALEKTIEDVRHILKIVGKPAKKIYIYAIPKEVEVYKEMSNDLKKEFSAEINVFAVNDTKKYDPEGKAQKAKPGKPGILVE